MRFDLGDKLPGPSRLCIKCYQSFALAFGFAGIGGVQRLRGGPLQRDAADGRDPAEEAAAVDVGAIDVAGEAGGVYAAAAAASVVRNRIHASVDFPDARNHSTPVRVSVSDRGRLRQSITSSWRAAPGSSIRSILTAPIQTTRYRVKMAIEMVLTGIDS